VLAEFEAALGRDKTRSHILGFTSLGLLEMTRKKVTEDMMARLQRTCPYCEGSGRVLSEETVAHRAERELIKRARSTDDEAFLVVCHPSVASVIIGPNGSVLHRLEQLTGKTIYVKGSETMHVEEFQITSGDKQAMEELALPVRPGDVVDIRIEEPHITNPNDGIARIEGYVIDVEGGGRRVGQRHKVEITRVFRTYAKARLVVN